MEKVSSKLTKFAEENACEKCVVVVTVLTLVSLDSATPIERILYESNHPRKPRYVLLLFLLHAF